MCSSLRGAAWLPLCYRLVKAKAMLAASDLTVARGGVPILQGVKLAVEAGEALILKGPNGSGKTTLLRCLAGIQPAISGTCEVSDEDVVYAAHLDGIKANLSVRENLRFWADVFGQADIDNALQAFDLKQLANRAAHSLSAGQKRRLSLARLLVSGRSLWLLDEPTVSLDAASVALFAEVIRGHLQRGGAAIVATHIDLGFEARVLEIGQFKASRSPVMNSFDESFL